MSDVIVIGAGVMGCSIALRLAQAGLRTTVLERSIPGAEASSAAAGILAPQKEAERPGPFLELCLRSRGMYRAFADELLALSGIDVAYLSCGALDVAFTEAAVHRLEETVAWQKAMGLRAELLSGADARALEQKLSPSILAAAHFPDDHQVDNRLLVRALSIAASRAGTTFRSGYVRSVIAEQNRVVGVDVDGERLMAGAVVVAAGSWTSLVQGARIAPHAVRPARGQMVQLQTRVPMLERVVFCDRGYLVPRKDGRVIAGSTVELAGFEKHVTASGLAKILAMALELVPELADVPVVETWAGLRPYTDDHLPILGEGPLERLFVASGHFRNGILLAPITARLVSQLVLGQRPSVDLSPFRYDRLLTRCPPHARATDELPV